MEFEQQQKTYEGSNLTIWEIADLEYMKHTFIDAENLNCCGDDPDSCND